MIISNRKTLFGLHGLYENLRIVRVNYTHYIDPQSNIINFLPRLKKFTYFCMICINDPTTVCIFICTAEL